jgi:hypothetical protein
MISTSPFAPHVTPTTLASTFVPHAALMTPPATSSVVPVSPPAAQPVSRILLAGVVLISTMVHPHPMQTRGAAGFRQPKLYVAATLSPIAKSVRAALIDPHWWVAMKE